MPPRPRKPDRHAEAIKQAMTRFMRGDRAAAIDALLRVLKADPKHAEAHRLAAFLFHDARKHERARYHAERAVALNPNSSQAHTMLGMVLDALGESDAALASMRHAVELNPRDAEGWTTLGLTLDAHDRTDEAIEAHRRALVAHPDHVAAGNNLALSLLTMGEARDAVDLTRRLALAHPDSEHAAERHAYCLNYDDRATRAEINAAHRRWGELAQRARPIFPQRPIRTDRPLRVGFMSSDFRRHSVSHFIRPVLGHLDRDRFEVHAIFTSAHADEVTHRLRPLADRWHDAAHLAEPALAQHIADAGIDVLIELNGHFAGHRLGVMARKPAPVQLTWLGYANTTGLTRIDARLVDTLTDPPELDDRPEAERETERLLRLDPCFLCYTPPADAPDPAPAPPCTTGEPFTFASFNDSKKMSQTTLDMWAAVLGRTEGSRLLLKCGAYANDAVRAHTLTAFEKRGVDPSRIELASHTPDPANHLAIYRRVDVALDTFPYHGTTTTCEALWMGVPVVTRVGETHAARVGLSLLTAIGLPELCACDEQGFIDLAASLAADRDRLAALRSGLRGRVADSPLTDAPAFAARFAHAILTLIPDP
ncbi:MAG: tetratricopeptide repeat protein [Phycisphaeraceae bacterium]|nr:MAG: tetratricopeptide repeat protein [Phycisphaeraceae bacterium]